MDASGSNPDRPLVVMGVSGCGKSTVGAALAARLGRPFVDADDLHPAANKAKMAAGVPLEDADRMPWLALVGDELARRGDTCAPPVVACSALKRVYRDTLRSAAPGTIFIHLDVDAALLTERVADRAHEFMPTSLLASQLSTLEPLAPDEAGVVIDARRSVADVLEAIATALVSVSTSEELS